MTKAKIYTTGGHAISLALTLCKEVSLFGFGPDSAGQ